MIKPRPVFRRNRILIAANLCFMSAFGHAQDTFLPLPQGGPEPSAPQAQASESRFMKPTKSIKPPPVATMTTTPSGIVVAAQPQVNTPTAARLRRLILMPGDLSPAAMREQILASGQGRTPVTVVGMNAPSKVLTTLANFFGNDVNADTQKRLVETVRQGMGNGDTAKKPRRVEVVGWLPTEGVMAVAVYPEG